MTDTLILGGGAAGLFLASLLKSDYKIIEHNPYVGAKIKISGGGRCNITNTDISPFHYLVKEEGFLEPAFKNFSNAHLLKWLKARGCEPVIRKRGQYFCPKSSEELLNIFKKEVKNTVLNCEILDVKEGFEVKTSKGIFRAKNLVVATGGLSYRRVGASGVGYEIAKKMGHGVTPLRPALVGFTVQKEQFWFKELFGISFEAVVRVEKRVFEDDILFTHKGISGPAILNASLYWQKGEIEISFLKKSVKSYLKNPNKNISTQLPLPKRFVKEFLKSIGLEDKKVKELGKEELRRLGLLNSYRFAPAGTFGFERAEVTKGGVDIESIDRFTMQSSIKEGLYFLGEVLDVTGELGGYNFQWAFSSAALAYRSIRNARF